MTPLEAFMATQTEVFVPDPTDAAADRPADEPRAATWANHEGPNQVTTYSQFIKMKPPTFSKVEDPLEAEAWIKAIEAKFSSFVMPCSEENKANFIALQL
jgi:LmbE family N-acetylglucosaminyl deacetylase